MSQVIGRMPDGAPIHGVDLRAGPLTARVMTLGAVVQDLRLGGQPLVLGSPDPAEYLGALRHMGTITGRFANRIGGAGFVLDGVRHATDPNWRGRHTLHGGGTGAGQRLWRILRHAADRVTLALDLPDGDMGFPGTLAVRATIRLGPGAALSFDIRATTDRPTPCSFTHHGYIRLDGTDTLRLTPHHRLEVDADLIPTGRLLPPAPPDLTQPLDLSLALPRHGRRPRPVAWLTSRRSGLTLRVDTTAPGLQLHTTQAGPATGLAIEAQEWPDAPNHPGFPNAILRPGRPWRQITRYIFTEPRT